MRSALLHSKVIIRLKVFAFPCSFCNDGGRRINNLLPDWPNSLEGFAKRAYEFYEKELRPHGYKLHAEVISYPGGMPGEIGFFLKWRANQAVDTPVALRSRKDQRHDQEGRCVATTPARKIRTSHRSDKEFDGARDGGRVIPGMRPHSGARWRRPRRK